MIDLDRSGGDQRRRGEAGRRLGGDRADAGRDESARRCRRRRSVPPAAAVEPAAAVVAPAPVAPELAEWPAWARASFLSTTSGPIGQERGERLVGLLELRAEAPSSACRRLQVAAHERTGPAAQPLGDLAELDPDLVAGQQPRLGRLGQRDPRAHEQRLDARHRRLHRLGDLLVGERIHLAQHERGALRLGQVVDVADQQPELLAVVDLVGRGLRRARRSARPSSRRRSPGCGADG